MGSFCPSDRVCMIEDRTFISNCGYFSQGRYAGKIFFPTISDGRKMDIAKAALDLYFRLSIARSSGIVLVKTGAFVAIAIFLFLQLGFPLVMELAKTGVDLKFGGKGLRDEHPDIGIGFEYGQLADIVVHPELHVAREFDIELHAAAQFPDIGLYRI